MKRGGGVLKDFDTWNIQKKKKIHANDGIVLFHEREIWWYAIGANVGYEQDGKNDLIRVAKMIQPKNRNPAVKRGFSEAEAIC